MKILGKNAVLEGLKSDAQIDIVYIKAKESDTTIKKIISLAKQKKIVIKEVDRKKLDFLAEGKLHQGVIANVNNYNYFEMDELLSLIEENKSQGKPSTILVLDSIEDPHNFGAIIRTAECSGVDAIIIPKRRSVQVNETVERTSVGAVSYMKIVKVTNLVDSIEKLKKAGIWIYGLDMDGSNYYDTDISGNVALVVGNEGKGIGSLVKKSCDFIISIPQFGKINSLNASVAASLAMYEVVRQRSTKK